MLLLRLDILGSDYKINIFLMRDTIQWHKHYHFSSFGKSVSSINNKIHVCSLADRLCNNFCHFLTFMGASHVLMLYDLQIKLIFFFF